MSFVVRRFRSVALFMAITASSRTVAPAKAEVTCGGTIYQDEELQADLSCPCVRGANETYVAVTVVGPAKLNMNGKTISCQYDGRSNAFIAGDRGAVILVTGSKGYIGKGQVQRGNFGIRLAGYGGHVVDTMHVSSTGDDSLLISSSNNRVIDSIFDDCGQGIDGDFSGDCVDIELGATHNIVENCFMLNFGDDGIDCDGSYNTLKGNLIDNTHTSKLDTESGITIRGTQNLVLGNKVYNTNGDGIEAKYDDPDYDCSTPRTGGQNRIVGNMVTGARTGLRIRSDGNMVSKNHVSACTKEGIKVDNGKCVNDDDYPFVGGNNNMFAQNQCMENREDGFEIEGHRNMFMSNVAQNNGKNGFKDEGEGNFFVGNQASGNADDFVEE